MRYFSGSWRGQIKMHKSIFISDTHLGSLHNNSKKLFNLLENIETEQLFLVGDIINNYASKEHPDIVKFIELIQSKMWKVIYISGNNEEDRCKPSPIIGELFLKENYIYLSNQTLVYLEHGHRFHTQGTINKLLKQGVRYLKRFLFYTRKSRVTHRENDNFKVQKESFYYRYIKPFAQKVLHHSFKSYMSIRTKEKGCSTIICGHFHIPEDSIVKGIRYLNCGDWVKNSSYIIESRDGEFTLITT